MKITRLAALLLLSASSAFASADMSLPRSAAGSAAAPEVPVEAEGAKIKCPCDEYGFKALTDKARAVEEYWTARRETKIATVVGGAGAIFSLIFQNPNGIRQSTETYDRSRNKMVSARIKAESLGAMKVTGDDMDGSIDFKLVKGVDYTIER